VIDKEIDMTTSKPMELGRASDETKGVGTHLPDNIFEPVGEKTL
jgi:hypothetical protein